MSGREMRPVLIVGEDAIGEQMRRVIQAVRRHDELAIVLPAAPRGDSEWPRPMEMEIEVAHPLGPKRPPAHWTRIDRDYGRPSMTGWTYAGLTVTHELANMEAPDGTGDVIPQWLTVVSKRGARASDRDCQRALSAFDMAAAMEDNHHPGVGRGFFLVVDPARRVDCECKLGERLVTEADGFQWSNEDGACRGCEYHDTFGPPCRIHSERARWSRKETP